MVTLNKIYTRTGDKGTTALGTGDRVAKYDLRIAAYGTVDEANSIIGVARLEADGEISEALARIQNDLFDLGADLCTPDQGKDLGYEPLRIISAQVERLEREIDSMNKDLATLKSFILPGGSATAAHLHVARTVCRRAERLMVELSQMPDEPVGEFALQYINRLSDYLFVAARFVNNKGKDDVLWVPGANR